MKVIPFVVVADDYGISIDRSRGIIQSMLLGIVTNTSIMANMDTAGQALDMLRSNGLLGRVGIHLNLTEGRPLSPASEISSLVDSDHMFLGKGAFHAACLNGEVQIEHVQTEVRAQIQWFIRNVGFPPVHVDSHQHVHVLPPLVGMLAVLLFDMGVTFVRTPAPAVPNRRQPLCTVCSVVSSQAIAARKQFRAQGLWCLDAFVGLSFCGGSYTRTQVLDAVAAQVHAGARSIEMMTHPGFTEPTMLDPTLVSPQGLDSVGVSEDRHSELMVLCDPEFPIHLQPIVHLTQFTALLS